MHFGLVGMVMWKNYPAVAASCSPAGVSRLGVDGEMESAMQTKPEESGGEMGCRQNSIPNNRSCTALMIDSGPASAGRWRPIDPSTTQGKCSHKSCTDGCSLMHEMMSQQACTCRTNWLCANLLRQAGMRTDGRITLPASNVQARALMDITLRDEPRFHDLMHYVPRGSLHLAIRCVSHGTPGQPWCMQVGMYTTELARLKALANVNRVA